MKIQDFTFSSKLRNETEFMDFVNEVRNSLNLGRYQMRVVTTAPDWTGEGGEHLLYISGTTRRFYFWDDTNSTWHYLEWSGADNAIALAAGSIGAAELAATTVVAGSYNSANITVDADGRLTAAANGTSRVVATVQLTGQTGDIGATTIVTPAAAGLYRVNIYVICTTAGGGTLATTIGFSDIVGAKTLKPTTDVDLSSTANGAVGTSFISSVTSVAITYTTAITGKTGSPQYALYISLEALT